MSTKEAQENEGNVKDDIEYFLSLYSDIDQYGLNQLLKYIEELKTFSKTYRQTHTQLKRLCDSNEYTRLYGHYDEVSERITTWFKKATARETELMSDLLSKEASRVCKEKEEKERKEREEKEEKERKENEEKAEKARKREEKARKFEEKERKEREEKEEEKAEKARRREEKERNEVQNVTIEAKHFSNKVEPELKNLVDDAGDLAEIAESIKGLEKLKEKQNELQIKCQLVLEDAYENEFRDMFNLSDSKISECIKTQKKKMKTSKQEAITKDK